MTRGDDVLEGDRPSPVMVAICSVMKRTTADVLPSRGVADHWAVQASVLVLLESGHFQLILEGDDEPLSLR